MPAGVFTPSIKQRMSPVASSTIAEESESEAAIDIPPVLEASPNSEGGPSNEQDDTQPHSLSTVDEGVMAQGFFPLDSTSGFEDIPYTESSNVEWSEFMTEVWEWALEESKDLSGGALNAFWAGFWGPLTEAELKEYGRLSGEKGRKLVDGMSPGELELPQKLVQ